MQPLWGEKISFPAVPATATTLFVTVYDDHKGKAGEEVGASAVLLANAFRTGREECRVSLSFKGKPAGELTLLVTFTAGEQPSSAAEPPLETRRVSQTTSSQAPVAVAAAPPPLDAAAIRDATPRVSATLITTQGPAVAQVQAAPQAMMMPAPMMGGFPQQMVATPQGIMVAQGSSGNLVAMAPAPVVVNINGQMVQMQPPSPVVQVMPAPRVSVSAMANVPHHSSWNSANMFPTLHTNRKILMCLIDATCMAGPCEPVLGSPPLRTLARDALAAWTSQVEARQASTGSPPVGVRTLCSDPNASGFVVPGTLAALDSGFMCTSTIYDMWEVIPWGVQQRHRLSAAWHGVWSVFTQEGLSTVAPLLTVLVTDGAPDDMQAFGDSLVPCVHHHHMPSVHTASDSPLTSPPSVCLAACRPRTCWWRSSDPVMRTPLGRMASGPHWHKPTLVSGYAPFVYTATADACI